MGYVAHLMSTKGFLQSATESKVCFLPMHKSSLVPRLSNGGKKEPGNIHGKHHLTLALPTRLQNETTFTHDILSTQQKVDNLT